MKGITEPVALHEVIWDEAAQAEAAQSKAS
jgi:hypothetical protein